RCVRNAASQSEGFNARDRAGDDRQIRRDRHRGGPAAARDAAGLVEHSAALAAHFRDHGGAGLSLAAFVRPMLQLTANMMAFRKDRENPERVVALSGRQDEIDIAERELAAMQRDLASMLQQKSGLASLRLAVSKINHDLRNLLSSAQLFSDG